MTPRFDHRYTPRSGRIKQWVGPDQAPIHRLPRLDEGRCNMFRLTSLSKFVPTSNVNRSIPYLNGGKAGDIAPGRGSVNRIRDRCPRLWRPSLRIIRLYLLRKREEKCHILRAT